MAKIELPTTLDELRAMSFADRAALWAKYSKYPFKRQMRSPHCKNEYAPYPAG